MARMLKHIFRHEHFRAKYQYEGVFFDSKKTFRSQTETFRSQWVTETWKSHSHLTNEMLSNRDCNCGSVVGSWSTHSRVCTMCLPSAHSWPAYTAEHQFQQPWRRPAHATSCGGHQHLGGLASRSTELPICCCKPESRLALSFAR